MKDPYETLGVKPDASPGEIKKAYRKLAKAYHPDSTGGDKAKEAKFKDISTAYDILGDAAKRQKFDQMKRSGFAGVPGFDGGGGGDAVDLGELFAQMFGGGGPRGPRGSRGGRSPHVEYQVFGGGMPRGGGGFGNLFEQMGGEDPRRRRPEPPPPPREQVLTAPDGSRLVQRGLDVTSDVRIGFDQAALGAVVDVATLTGKASVKIPPGTASGVKLRLKGKGAHGAAGETGDHLVTIQIDVPKQLSEESQKLLVQFMRSLRRKT